MPTADTWLMSVVTLYDEAQLDVMRRASTLAQDLVDHDANRPVEERSGPVRRRR